MKKLLLLLFFSHSAQASCPNLSGKYVTVDPTGSSKLFRKHSIFQENCEMVIMTHRNAVDSDHVPPLTETILTDDVLRLMEPGCSAYDSALWMSGVFTSSELVLTKAGNNSGNLEGTVKHVFSKLKNGDVRVLTKMPNRPNQVDEEIWKRAN